MKFPKLIALTATLFITACMVSPNAASAGWLGNFFHKKAPKAPSLTQIYPIQNEKSFESAAKTFHKLPSNKPQLEYSIQLPKDWTSQEVTQSADVGGFGASAMANEVARYKSPLIETMTARVTIKAVQLTREITAKNWLKNYIYKNSCTLQDKMVEINLKKATAKCISSANGTSLYTHALATINGNTLMLVEFKNPLPLTKPLNFLACASLDSFQFILKTNSPIEKQKIFRFANVLKFLYPESWVPNGLNTSDNNSMSMQLFNETVNKGTHKQINGMIRFVVIRRDAQTSLIKEAAKLKKYFNHFLGLKFKKLISSKTIPAENRFLFSRYEVYKVSGKSADIHQQDVRLVTLGSKNWYVFAFLLTPTQNDDFYNWAVNTRAFNMIVESIQ